MSKTEQVMRILNEKVEPLPNRPPQKKIGNTSNESLTVDLKNVQLQLQEILRQTQLAKAFPVALLDSQRLETIILSTTEAYNNALKEMLTRLEQINETQSKQDFKQIKQVFEQSENLFHRMLDLLQLILQSLNTQSANVDLEREVLLKLRKKLNR